ncbi:ATP-binding protein [Amycolatopsis umgeniensis]|uniref:Uncharacterized protein n=1 Tax=Amycolatopsis umgeniensis TaxID=336628 RepID=A0A841BEF5_9PSEU|nr:ATP-binding protein [Amycolatopsis umgeniensis]MBB5857123.1 hypothetical protein [Amycolatopsis umgeniensis]
MGAESLRPAQETVLRDIVGLLKSGRSAVVNLTGPLGVGKTTVLTALTRTPWMLENPGSAAVVDGADHPGAVATLVGTPTVVASRRPLPFADVTVELPRWENAEIRTLAERHGISRAADVDVVVRLSGGLPLVARCLCQALRKPVSAAVPGALADQALREILARLRSEPQDGTTGKLLDALAVVGYGDEELLAELVEAPRDQDWFAAVSDLSLVTATATGLAVIDPFQALLDLKHRWRRPVARRAALAKAVTRNRHLLATTADGPTRDALIGHSLFLSDDPEVRQALFPTGVHSPRVRPAEREDHDRIGELVHAWARRGELDTGRCERLLDTWLTHGADGFHLVCDPDDHPVGMTYIPRITEESIAAIEPIVQQHTADLTDSPGGVFVGLAISEQDRPASHAALLRHILISGVSEGRAIIATPWPEYQRLARRFGFAHHGDARHDPYDCGRRSEIYHHRFTPAELPAWLDRLSALGSATPGPGPRWYTGQVKKALALLHDPARLADSPLTALPGVGGAEGLRALLVTAIDELIASGEPATAQAGRVLHAYYLRRRTNHLGAATRLHLSRATYFRRLDHGITLLAERFLGAGSTRHSAGGSP